MIEKEVFKVKDLANTTSILFFGKKKKQGIEELKKFKIKGRMSDNTEMALVSLQWKEYEDKFDL